MKPTQVHNREELCGKSSQAELKLPEQEAGDSDFYLRMGLIMNYCIVDESDYDLLQSVDDADLKFNMRDAQFELIRVEDADYKIFQCGGSSF